MTCLSHYTSPLGNMTMASDGKSLIGLWFDGQKYDRVVLQKGQAKQIETDELTESELPVFELTRKWLDTYFSGEVPDFTPPIRITCSDFRKRVAQIMLKIPYGKTMTYGEIARIIASEREMKTMSSQAVGGAVGHNPISIIIPCHRVIGSQGKLSSSDSRLSAKALTGYAGGLDRKLWLLNHEQHCPDSLDIGHCHEVVENFKR